MTTDTRESTGAPDAADTAQHGTDDGTLHRRRASSAQRKAELDGYAATAARNAEAEAREAERQAALKEAVKDLPGDSMQDPEHAERRAFEGSGGLGNAPRSSDVKAAAPAENKQARPENLDELNVPALRALAKQLGITVTRSDGSGSPRRSDYVAALS